MQFFESGITQLGVKTKSTTKSLQVIDEIKAQFYNVVFLDIFMPLKSGFDLIPEIQNTLLTQNNYNNRNGGQGDCHNCPEVRCI